MACLGRCHAPIKSRRDVPDPATSDTAKASQAKADSVKASQLATGQSLPSRPDVTDRIQTASLKAAALIVLI